jgi:cathepsin A (carboxypeptidase C)
VYDNLEGDFEKSYAQDIPIILAAGVPVTVYNGALDIICNFYGEAETLANLAWPGQAGFNGATNQTWTVAGQTAGSYKTYQNLTFVVVANAGHMVPHDQPANALALMETVLANNW